MSLLGVAVGDASVEAVVVDDAGVLLASTLSVLPDDEVPAEAVWRACLAAVTDVLGRAGEVTAVGFTAVGAVVLWDRDTLGSPRPVLREATDGWTDALRSVAEHEPHTWALVEADRYAVGGPESYLLARATRGLEHLTDVTHAAATGLLGDDGAWDVERCRAAGVPVDALPEIGPTHGDLATTEPSTFLGLALPVRALGGGDARSAALLAGN